MSLYRFKLENGSKKYHCPSCTKKSFVRYLDCELNELLPHEFGRCDRESKCQYHYNPYKTNYIKELWEQEKHLLPTYSPKQKTAIITKPVFFDFETFKETLNPSRYEKNVFIQNLLQKVPFPFPMVEVKKVVEHYRLGTIANGYRAGAVTFPFIDLNQNIRAVQVKQFDPENHTIGTDFLHSILEKHYKRNKQPIPVWLSEYIKQEKRVSSLFGAHLLSKYPHNPIALVEAPKTAIYGTLYFGLPKTKTDMIWLAVYNKSSFSLDKITPLQGRTIFVFPDLSENKETYNEWKLKAQQFALKLPQTKFIFSNLLERYASEEDKKKGIDIADVLIKLDWKDFNFIN